MTRFRMNSLAAVCAIFLVGASYTGDEELDKEKCGSGLRYSFDVDSCRVIQEVGVDAKTGRVIANKVEGFASRLKLRLNNQKNAARDM
jgi:hypothetical protein